MKKILKYLLWLPFAVSIGSFVIYTRYILMFKIDSNIIVTDEIKDTLNIYLIVAFISLFVGLLIIFIKKMIKLIKEDNKNDNLIDKSNNDKDFIDAIENNNNIINEESNFIHDIKTKDFVTVKVNDNFNVNKNNIKNQIKCPKCNNILDVDAVICTNCGVLIDKNILDNINKNNISKHNKKFSFKKFIINFLIIILCIFLIFLIVNKIINKSEQNYNNINYNLKISK